MIKKIITIFFTFLTLTTVVSSQFLYFGNVQVETVSAQTEEEELEEIQRLQDQLDAKEKEIQALQEAEQRYQGAVGEKRSQANSLQDVIFDFNYKIKELENEIGSNRKSIADINIKIKQTELEIMTREGEITRTRDFIGATLREIYESTDQEIMELIFQYEDFSEFFNQVQYRDLLQSDLYIKLEKIKELKASMELQKAGLDIQKEDLERLKEGLQARNEILASQRSQKEVILTQTKNEEVSYRKLLNSTRDNQEIIQRQIFELEDALRSAINKSKLPLAVPGVLSWPTEGILTQGYGCTSFARSSKFYPTCFHNGIDIASGYGTPVRSARQGKIVAVANAPYAYGKWIAVEHDNGLITMYAHLSLQSVGVGKSVGRGEVIGYMGSTGMSTGSHLHFTVYAPGSFSTKPSTISGTLPIGATVNPFDYLP